VIGCEMLWMQKGSRLDTNMGLWLPDLFYFP
jgi:hypothetical protein